MTPVAPTIHAFDPLLAGKVGLSIDAPASGTTKIDWYASLTSTGAHTVHLATTYPTTGIDALSVVIDSGSTLYCVAQVTDSTGSSVFSGQVEADVSAGPPPPPAPLTQVQHLQAALGGTYATGDVAEVFPPTPTTSKTVQADGSIS